MSVNLDRIPPQNLDAEQSVLGSMLLGDREAIARAIEILRPDDFYRDAHRAIFDAMAGLFDRMEAIDLITVSEELKKKGLLEDLGGLAYLASLANMVPTAANVEYYARIVEEKAVLRELIAAATRIVNRGYAGSDEVEVLLDQAEQMIFEISQRRTTRGYSSLRDVLMKTFERIEHLYTTRGGVTGVPTGFTDLDQITSGLQQSEFIVVAARPSMGKTMLCLNIGRHAAVNHKIPVAIFSLEMSQEQLAQRLLCAEAGVDGQRLRTGYLADSDWPRLSHALGRLSEAPIFIDDTPGISVLELRAKARRMKAEHNLGLIIIDYLQLMQTRGRSENRQQEISEVSRSLKALARELQLPVLAASQLSRAVEQRQDRRPLLSDLRECLAGDSAVALASGEVRPIAELVGQNPKVVTLDGWRVTTAQSARVWKVGERPVYRLSTRTGRAIRATANHPFRQIDGWTALAHLRPGDRIAIPRAYPSPSGIGWEPERFVLLAHLIGDGSYVTGQPLRYISQSEDNLQAVADAARKLFGIEVKRGDGVGATALRLSAGASKHHPNPCSKWLMDLGIWGQRSHQKVIPAPVFAASNGKIAFFLRHLWATDGCVHVRKDGKRVTIYYATNSSALAEQVQHLLARTGVHSAIRQTRKADYRPMYHVCVDGRENQRVFAMTIGAFGPRVPEMGKAMVVFASGSGNTNVDTLPRQVWSHVRQRMREMGVSTREMARLRGTTYGGTSHFRFAPSRTTLAEYAQLLDDVGLQELALGDVFWDEVKRIEPDGTAEVYDMEVPGTHNFVANGIVVHNSGAIEQDADVVAFIYRDDYYNPDSEKKNIAEIIVAKQRNGPTDKVELVFMKETGKFGNIDRKHRNG